MTKFTLYFLLATCLPAGMACNLLLFTSPANASTTGWDYNLTKKCVKSVDPQDPNYYQDTSECSGDKNWTIAIQSESELGLSCIGNNNHSLPINTANSPLFLNWHPTQKSHPDDSPWSVELTTDLLSKTHPCSGGNFNWYSLMDHVGHGGGPFVKPNEIATSAKLKLTAELTEKSALRSFVAFQGFWDNVSYGIELNYYLSPNWGDAHSDPAIIQIAENNSYYFFALDGKAFGFTQNLGQEQALYVNWLDILNYLSDKSYITLPEDWANSATGAIYIGTELNNFESSGSGKSTLMISNFRNASTATIPGLPAQAGDLNGDGQVDIFDYQELINNFGNPWTIFDYQKIITNFGK